MRVASEIDAGARSGAPQCDRFRADAVDVGRQGERAIAGHRPARGCQVDAARGVPDGRPRCFAGDDVHAAQQDPAIIRRNAAEERHRSACRCNIDIAAARHISVERRALNGAHRSVERRRAIYDQGMEHSAAADIRAECCAGAGGYRKRTGARRLADDARESDRIARRKRGRAGQRHRAVHIDVTRRRQNGARAKSDGASRQGDIAAALDRGARGRAGSDADRPTARSQGRVAGGGDALRIEIPARGQGNVPARD